MSPVRKGPIAQRQLLAELIELIDASMVPNSTAHKDIARSKLRALLADPEVNWSTPFILHNLNPKRCRYLSSIGHWVSSKYTLGGWHGPVAEKADAED